MDVLLPRSPPTSDSGWLLVLIPILALWVHWESGKEEHRLIESFGPAYVQYQDKVRRYL